MKIVKLDNIGLYINLYGCDSTWLFLVLCFKRDESILPPVHLILFSGLWQLRVLLAGLYELKPNDQ